MAERRPIATRNTAWAAALARRVAATGLTANMISTLGLVIALAGGWQLASFADAAGHWRWSLFLGALCIQLRLLCNMLDGMVAVLHGRATALGALYNDVPDRMADVALLVGAGLALGEDAHGPALGAAAAMAALLTAYVRVLGGSLGTKQHFFGPQSKSQRMAVLTGATLLGALGPDRASAKWLLLAALVIILTGSLLTSILRLRAIAGELRGRG
ncbi:MAG: CDP-alcohol phosphatidyltransferase family protein [Steroidobacteraceae bacterium]